MKVWSLNIHEVNPDEIERNKQIHCCGWKLYVSPLQPTELINRKLAEMYKSLVTYLINGSNEESTEYTLSKLPLYSCQDYILSHEIKHNKFNSI